MYESPIMLIERQMRTEVEKEVFRAIKEVGVDVDKDELIKALQYYRDQYSKGYSDGVKEFAEKVNPMIEEMVDIMFDENHSRCMITNCSKHSSIPCGDGICLDENKSFGS